MDDGLKRKILYIVVTGIILFFVLLAFLLIFRNPSNQVVITRQEYIQKTGSSGGANLVDMIPKIEEKQASLPGELENTEDSPENRSSDTDTSSVQKALRFFSQAMTLPWIIVSSSLPLPSSCGGAGQSVCQHSPNTITVITNETNTTNVENVTIMQQIVELPLSIQDSLQDVIFYRFIGLLQQYLVTNSDYPGQLMAEDTAWLEQMIATREMSQFYYDVFTNTTPSASNCGTKEQKGFCYESNGKDATLYIRLRAATKECPYGGIKSWNAQDNALQIACFSSVGTL